MDILASPLHSALDCIKRGWHVFPCWPQSKAPMTPHGFKDATTDESQVREWWTRTPNANVAISTGPSDLTVFDADHGARCLEDFQAWCKHNGMPTTYTVRTGRRVSKEDGVTPEYGVQMYFAGVRDSVTGWELDGFFGDVKSVGGYVIAVGSIHPDSGEPYELLADEPLAPVPGVVRSIEGRKKERVLEGKGPITEWRNDSMVRILGKLRADGADDEMVRAFAYRTNETRMAANPLDVDELDRVIANVCKYPQGEPEPVITIGGGKELEGPEPRANLADWQTLFHTRNEMANAPPVTFLIDGFLQREGVTAIAAPVRERKSLIALNIAHALLTGEKLFDFFEVTHRPSRVIYLCPEVSLGPFTDRLRKIRLMDYVGETLFCRTLSADGRLTLNAPELHPALPGSVVILDTAIRFLSGDENSAFADSIFALLRAGAESVVMLHHSPKDAGDTMTLESAMRGSGDLGAFLASCWGTRLQNPLKPYESASFMSNLKQRDFESKDFEVLCSPDCRMHIVGDPTQTLSTLAPRRRGNVADKDGKDAAALAMLKEFPKLSNAKMSAMLKTAGIKRGTDWVRKKRYGLIQNNGGMMP